MMVSKYKDAAINRLLEKEVEESVLVHRLGDMKDISYIGLGTCSVSEEQLFEGSPTLKVVVPRKTAIQQTPRAYGCGRVRVHIPEEDWRSFNRISFWIYPVKDVYENAFISIEIKNEGKIKYPREGKLEGLHFGHIVAGKWNHVVWEFPDAPRDKITQFQINFEARGKQPEEKNENIAYISTVELQKVKADKYAGWDTDGSIIVSHSGYMPEQSKVATISEVGEREFAVINADTGEKIFTGRAETRSLDIGAFSTLDFSAVRTEGNYYVTYAGKKSVIFPIRKDMWLPAIRKIKRFFYTERCGVAVDGVHSACHLDCYVAHPDGRRLPAYGGWHDAGDLSQFLCNTSEATLTFLDMAKTLQNRNTELYNSCMEEARQGLDWLLRTQFEDGYRVLVISNGVMSDGERDSCTGACGNKPAEAFEILCAVAAEATAYDMYKETEPEYAQRCLDVAKKDFEIAMEQMKKGINRNPDYYCAPVQVAGEAVFASVKLYVATGAQKYLDIAVQYAGIIEKCQQSVWTEWEIPFVGFFYEDESHRSTLTYNHQSHEQIMIQALAELLQYAPEHEHAPKWRHVLELYREYILQLAVYSEPYGQLPAFIYFVSEIAVEKNNFSNNKFSQGLYEKQVENGIRLNEGVYLRRMPVMTQFQGSFGVGLTKAKAVSTLAKALKDKQLADIANHQLQWIVGNNPFNRSYMYGEGYDYSNMMTMFFFDVEGEIPVGFQCYEDTDVPYMPMAVNATYLEVYVHPTARFLWILADLIEEEMI